MADASDGSTKDFWDKVSALSGILAAVLVPLALAFIGNSYSKASKEREQSLNEATFKREWVQVGLSILRDANTTDNMREWAVNIINFYSKDVPIPPAAKMDLTKNGAVLPPSAQTQARTTPTGVGDTAGATATERVVLMNKLQTQGLKALLNRDLPGAVAAYDRAYESWPIFRDVDEIRSYLRKLSPPLSDQQWKEVYAALRRYDLRGVDPQIQSKLETSAH